MNCQSQQTTLSRYNGHNQRFLRETDQGQTVLVYGPDGYSVLFESEHRLVDATTVSTTTETIYLPTASGPMPVVAVINGAPYAIHADHLNTPRRLTDAQGQPRWQWPFSGFGEKAPQSIPAAGQPAIRFSLRYPGQVDDGNGLFYNFNRFYDPLAGRYTNADPIGLDGGWNRFGYVGGNALGLVDPEGLQIIRPVPGVPGFPIPNRSPVGMRDPDFPPGTGPNWSPAPTKRSPPRWWPSMPDEDAEFCRQERRRCAELCEEAECKPDYRNIWGGSIERCIRGCLPEICGGNKKGNK